MIIAAQTAAILCDESNMRHSCMRNISKQGVPNVDDARAETDIDYGIRFTMRKSVLDHALYFFGRRL